MDTRGAGGRGGPVGPAERRGDAEERAQLSGTRFHNSLLTKYPAKNSRPYINLSSIDKLLYCTVRTFCCAFNA